MTFQTDVLRLDDRVRQIDKEIILVQEKIQALNTLLQTGRINPTVYGQEAQQLSKQINQLQNERAEAIQDIDFLIQKLGFDPRIQVKKEAEISISQQGEPQTKTSLTPLILLGGIAALFLL